MSNPSALTPGPDHLAAGETVTSSSPKVTLGPAKAVVSAIAAAAVSVGTALVGVLEDGAIDTGEGVLLLVALLVGLGVPGIGTYITPTKVTAN